MGVLKFILRVIGWMVTIIVQVAASNIVVFIFSLLFGWMEIKTLLGWLTLLFAVWLGYVIGVNLAGQAALRLVWKDVSPLTRQRLIGSAVGALVPLLLLLVIGYSVSIGTQSSNFYDLVTNNWQPILAQVSMFAAVLGFYIPGIMKISTETKMGD
jgi:hypothetical protein